MFRMCPVRSIDNVQLVLPIDNDTINHWLVVLTPLKNMKVNGKDYPIYEMENEKCSKPPTRILWHKAEKESPILLSDGK